MEAIAGSLDERLLEGPQGEDALEASLVVLYLFQDEELFFR